MPHCISCNVWILALVGVFAASGHEKACRARLDAEDAIELAAALISTELLQVKSSSFRSKAAKQEDFLPGTGGAAVTNASINTRGVLRSTTGTNDNPLMFVHLPKAGGSYLKELISAGVPQTQIIQDCELAWSNPSFGSSQFSIGSMRNPFDYYLSLWSYASLGEGDFLNYLSQDIIDTMVGEPGTDASEVRVYGELPEDRRRFQAFVRAVSAPDLGLASLRFWAKYLDVDLLTRPDMCVETVPTFVTHSINTTVSLALSNFSVETGPIHCWVFTENIDSDVTRCLEMYEEIAGDGAVDWQAILDSSDDDLETNPTQHASSTAMYDDDTIAFVNRADRYLLRAFGYPSMTVD